MISYRSYLLGVLLATLVVNKWDGVALGLAMQDIKVELKLSDTELGFLTGIAFALFYSVLGLPIARWADRGNRVVIISLASALQCAGVALCGATSSFVQLLLVRIGVAVGEAGCVPPAHSLIADHFDRAERARAVSRYLLGYPVSAVLGYLLAGWLNELLGWRMMFVVLGLPGVALAALAWLTLKEPRRDRQVASQDLPEMPGLWSVCRTLWSTATFRHLLVCFVIVYFFGFGIQQWKPAFFIRSFGMSTGELGTWFAAIYGIGGFVGTWLGGELAACHAARDESRQLRAMAGMYFAFAFLSAATYLMPNAYLALAVMTVATIGVSMIVGPLFATIQTLVPERMRATSVALIYLFANLIGMGLGPLAAGALSDALRPFVGEESLRIALLALCPGYIWGAWHVWRGSRTVRGDLRALEERAG